MEIKGEKGLFNKGTYIAQKMDSITAIVLLICLFNY